MGIDGKPILYYKTFWTSWLCHFPIGNDSRLVHIQPDALLDTQGDPTYMTHMSTQLSRVWMQADIKPICS